MIWQIILFRNTIIDYRILIVIVGLTGIIAFLIDFKNYRKTYNEYGKVTLKFYAVFQYVFSYGFIACSIFILLNFYLAKEIKVTKLYKIISRSSLPGRKYHRTERKPTFIIYYNGFRKELVFSNDYYEKMNFYNKIDFEVQKGFLGFDIIKKKH